MDNPYKHTETNEDLRTDKARLEKEAQELREKCSNAASQKRLYTLFRLLCCLPLLVWATVRIYAYVDYRQHFYRPLKTAIETKDVETANTALLHAQAYLSARGDAFHNTTDIFDRSSNYNVGTLRSDIVYLLNTLCAVRGTNNTSSWEKRQLALGSIYYTLTSSTALALDHGSAALRIPEGISIYPYNVPMFWFGVLGGFMAFIALGPSISRIFKKRLEKRKQRKQAEWEALSPAAQHSRW